VNPWKIHNERGPSRLLTWLELRENLDSPTAIPEVKVKETINETHNPESLQEGPARLKASDNNWLEALLKKYQE